MNSFPTDIQYKKGRPFVWRSRRRRYGKIVKCAVCSSDVFIFCDYNQKMEVCFKCRKGELSGAWKGGEYVDHEGYIFIKAEEHPKRTKGGYVRKHRLMMEEHLGRLLTDEDVVHHLNEDKADNRIENLCLCANGGEHNKLHKRDQKEEE